MLISKNVNDCICEKIKELELKYGITLSQDYKVFLIKYNGGDTPKTKFSRGEIKTDIRRFFGFIPASEFKKSMRD